MGKRKLKSAEVNAIEDLLRQIRAAQSKGNYPELAKLRNQLGYQYRVLGDFENALEQHQEEIEISKNHNKSDKMGLGIAYRNMGEVYLEMKEEAKAIEYIKKYLRIAKEVNNLGEEQRACITFGRVYLSMSEKDSNDDGDNRSNSENQLTAEGALERAENWFRDAYNLLNENQLKEELNNDKELMLMKCSNCQNLGLTLELRGKLDDACLWLLKAVEIGRKYSFHENLAPCYSVLCGIYLKTGMSKDALNAARNATKTAKLLGNLALEVEANILEAKALFLADQMDVGKKLLKKTRQRVRKKDALHCYFEELDPLLTAAVKVCRTQDNLYVTREDETERKMKLHEILADNYTTLTNFAVAIAHYKKSCEYAERAGIQGKKLSRLYFSIAESYKDVKNYHEAYEYYVKEMELNRGNLNEEFKTQTNISVILEKMQESETEVVKSHEQAILLAQMASDLNKEVTARNNFAVYLKSVGKIKESEKEIEIINKIKRENVLSDNEDPDSQEDLLDEEEEFIDLDNLSEEEESDDETDNDRKKRRTKLNDVGETPLHLAAKKGDLKVVRRLIRQGENVNAKDNAGWTPLHEACNFGHAPVVEELLKNGANVNDTGGSIAEKLTPLHDAASNGHCEVMKILIQYGANVLARNIEGRIPIDFLVSWRKTESGQELSETEYVTYKEVKKELLKKYLKQAGKPYREEDEKISRKRALRCRSPEPSLLVTKTRDYGCPIPVKIITDDFDPDQEGDGRKIYQDVMKQVRRQDTGRKPSKSKSRPISPGPRGALIPAELDVHGTWLLPDDDAIASTSKSANRISKPKRKRDLMDDDIGCERSSRRTSMGHKNRRKSKSSFQEDELMDIDGETDSRDRQVSGESPASINQTHSPGVIRIDSDEEFSAMFESDFDPPLPSEQDDFLPTQRPSTSAVEFGKTVDVQVVDSDGKSDSESDRESPEISSVYRSDRYGKRSPMRKSRRQGLDSSDDDDSSVRDSNKKTPALKFSRIASALKQSNSNSSTNQLGRSRKPEKTLRQSRLSNKFVPKAKPSRSSNEYARENRSSSPEEIHLSPPPSVSSIRNREVWRLKVWIQGKPLLVPVEEEKLNGPVDWLASECARRYKDTHGVNPILKLQTKDGAMLSGSDPIRLVLDADTELEGIVTSFDLPPLVDRYCLACENAGVGEDLEIKSNLNVCQSSNALDVTDINLRGKAGVVLMTALNRQSSLNTLILSGCSLFDNGVLELCKVLPTLSGLTHLDLGSNGITIFGFVKFVEVFLETSPKADALSVRSRVPLGITTLILRHNPLGNLIGNSLAALLEHLTVLKRLDIADCDFTEKLFTHSRTDLTRAFSNSRLEELDISYNNLKEAGLGQYLQYLPMLNLIRNKN